MARLTTIGWALAGIAAAAPAQETAPDPATETDLTLPPRISAEPAPGDAVLEPAPDDRDDVLEAVVTRGQTDFNLPDLGSSFRDDDEERDPNQRIVVSFLNLYDPENRDPAEEAFPTLEETPGKGMLRVVEIRFGDRNRN